MRDLILSAFYLASQLHAHSWIVCTDYMEKNGEYFAHDRCRGYPRNGHVKVSGVFGEDVGYDNQPGGLGNPCKTGESRDDNSRYTPQFPMAIYYAGQQVILAHPMKNHGADAGCTNMYIPDNGNFIYRGPKNDGNDDHGRAYYTPNLVANLGISPTGQANSASSTYPKPGFQNAPKFCENTGLSLGTYAFNVPEDLEPGRYTFVWEWAFNGPTNIYANCWEVDVVATKSERDAELTTRGHNLYVACGGVTSNNEPGSSKGCDITQPTPVPITQPDEPITAPTIHPTKQANVEVFQLAGEISLPDYGANAPDRRDIIVEFTCKSVSPHFWFAEFETIVYSGDDIYYHLHQKDPLDIAKKKVGFHISFDNEPCNMLLYPVVATIDDKYFSQIIAAMGAPSG